MSDYLGRLADRTFGVVPVLRPRPTTLFEPAPIPPAGLEEVAIDRAAPSLEARRPPGPPSSVDRLVRTEVALAAHLTGRHEAWDPVQPRPAGDSATSRPDPTSVRTARATDREATPGPARLDASVSPGPTQQPSGAVTDGTPGSAVPVTPTADQERVGEHSTDVRGIGHPISSMSEASGADAIEVAGTADSDRGGRTGRDAVATGGPGRGTPVHPAAASASGAHAVEVAGTVDGDRGPTTGIDADATGPGRRTPVHSTSGASGAHAVEVAVPDRAGGGRTPEAAADNGVHAFTVTSAIVANEAPTTGVAGEPDPSGTLPARRAVAAPNRTGLTEIPGGPPSRGTRGSAVTGTTEVQRRPSAGTEGAGAADSATIRRPPLSTTDPARSFTEATDRDTTRPGHAGSAARELRVLPGTRAATGTNRADRLVPSDLNGSASEPAPTVTVHIGRVEVHTPPQPPPAQEPEPGPQQLSLEAYLDRRNSGAQ